MRKVKNDNDDNVLTVTVLISSALTLLVLYFVIVTDTKQKGVNFVFDEALQNIDTQNPTSHPDTNPFVDFNYHKEVEEENDDKENDFYSFGKPLPGADQIFFIDSSCIASNKSVGLESSKLELSDIEVCAIESAARSNVDKNIYILYTCPLDPLLSIERSSSRVQNLLDQYNVYVWQPKLALLFANTPLENFYAAHSEDMSDLQLKFGNELLTYMVLWRFGGVYMDMNLVTNRSFTAFGGDFVVMADKENAHSDVLALKAAGKNLAAACLKELEERILNDDAVQQSDEGVLTRALKTTCNLKTISVANLTNDCQGVAIVSPDVFISVRTGSDWNSKKHDQKKSVFLKKLGGNSAFRELHDQRHFQNSFSANFSKQPLAILSLDYCPLLAGL